MYCHETKIRVRYAETDQMGVVHHSIYALYFEESRTEAIRELGYSYREIEEKGIFMPVIDLKIKYIKPAQYDDLLIIKTFVKEIPNSTFKFEYETYNSKNQCINKAETTLAFINRQTNRPCRAPEWLTEVIQKHMNP
jgi:acyl-CoA thioester hydrolase